MFDIICFSNPSVVQVIEGCSINVRYDRSDYYSLLVLLASINSSNNVPVFSTGMHNI